MCSPISTSKPTVKSVFILRTYRTLGGNLLLQNRVLARGGGGTKKNGSFKLSRFWNWTTLSETNSKSTWKLMIIRVPSMVNSYLFVMSLTPCNARSWNWIAQRDGAWKVFKEVPWHSCYSASLTPTGSGAAPSISGFCFFKRMVVEPMFATYWVHFPWCLPRFTIARLL